MAMCTPSLVPSAGLPVGADLTRGATDRGRIYPVICWNLLGFGGPGLAKLPAILDGDARRATCGRAERRGGQKSRHRFLP